jgi:hypothetical protein
MMYIAYFVTNNNDGMFAICVNGDLDLTWQPSEGFWLVPGTETENGRSFVAVPDPQPPEG